MLIFNGNFDVPDAEGVAEMGKGGAVYDDKFTIDFFSYQGIAYGNAPDKTSRTGYARGVIYDSQILTLIIKCETAGCIP